jgi:lysozyme
MISPVADAIRTFEGFAPQAKWDYAQISNGYGTRALYPGEVIDAAEADRRFQVEVNKAREVVDRHAPGLDEGTKAALTSLTYNAGDKWVRSGLGEAVARGDLDQVRSIFQEYNKAGGEVLPGLVSRRAAEALWIGNPELVGAKAAPAVPGGPGLPAMPEVVAALDPEVTAIDAAGPAAAAAQPMDVATTAASSPASAVPPVQALKAATANMLASDAAARLNKLAEVLSHSNGEFKKASDILQVASASTGERSQISPLTGSNISEMARLLRLDNGHELLSGESDRNGDRDRRRTA